MIKSAPALILVVITFLTASPAWTASHTVELKDKASKPLSKHECTFSHSKNEKPTATTTDEKGNLVLKEDKNAEILCLQEKDVLTGNHIQGGRAVVMRPPTARLMGWCNFCAVFSPALAEKCCTQNAKRGCAWANNTCIVKPPTPAAPPKKP